METVCAWLDPRETTPRLDVFFALHCDVCELDLECDEERFPFAALRDYIESIREYVRD